MHPKVSIIILNWNGLEDTIECLESLENISYPNYEVIVVDNRSKGNDAQVLQEKFSDYIHLIENDKNYGFAEGNNIGMRYALANGTDYILLLNNDTTVDSNFLDELVKVAGSDKKIGILGPKVYYYYEPDRICTTGGKINWWLGDIIDIGSYKKDSGQYERIAERDWVSGCAMLIKKSVIEEVSLLDPTFFFGAEDYEFSTRARRAGFKVLYVPLAKIWHKGGKARRRLPYYPDSLRLVAKYEGVLGIRTRLRFFKKSSMVVPSFVPLFFCITVSYPKFMLRYLLSFKSREALGPLIRRLSKLAKASIYGLWLKLRQRVTGLMHRRPS